MKMIIKSYKKIKTCYKIIKKVKLKLKHQIILIIAKITTNPKTSLIIVVILDLETNSTGEVTKEKAEAETEKTSQAKLIDFC